VGVVWTLPDILSPLLWENPHPGSRKASRQTSNNMDWNLVLGIIEAPFVRNLINHTTISDNEPGSKKMIGFKNELFNFKQIRRVEPIPATGKLI
jgi:hypothetical protein